MVMCFLSALCKSEKHLQGNSTAFPTVFLKAFLLSEIYRCASLLQLFVFRFLFDTKEVTSKSWLRFGMSPWSVTRPEISDAGVTSKAGFHTPMPGAAMRKLLPSSFNEHSSSSGRSSIGISEPSFLHFRDWQKQSK